MAKIQNDKKPCKLCDKPTKNLFNIELRAVPLCESCAVSIFIQQATFYAKSK